MVPVTVNAIRCHSSQVLEGLPMNVLTFTLDRVRHPGGWSFSSHACTRPLLALSLLAVVVGAGCGDDPGGARVTIQTGQPPALVAFRDEASTEWQTLATSGTSTFEVAATGPYRVVVACERFGDWPSLWITQYARTPADEPLIEHDCTGIGGPFVARGQMVQPGEVSLGNIGHGSTSSNWSFEIPTAAGSVELVMLFGSFTVGFDRLGIRRDVQIAGNTQLASIDLAQEHTEALVPTRFTTANLQPNELLSSQTLLFAGNTIAPLQASYPLDRSEWDTKLAPETMLRATDHQNVRIYAAEASSGALLQRRFRGVSRDVHLGDPTSVTLPEPLGPVTFGMTTDRLAATWSTLPEHDDLWLQRTSFSSQSWNFHEIVLSRTFVDATGATSASLDLTGVPGFKREWRHDPTLPQSRLFVASRGASVYNRVYAGVSEPIDTTSSARALPVNDAAPGGFAADAMGPSLTGTPWGRAAITRRQAPSSAIAR